MASIEEIPFSGISDPHVRKEDEDLMFAWSVQRMVERGLEEVPQEFRQPVKQGLHFPVVEDDGKDMPVIDFAKVQEGNSDEVAKFLHACEEWGFFQLTNHGLPDELIQRTKRDGREFFDLPAEEKVKYVAEDPQAVTKGYGRINFYSEENKSDWGDLLVLEDSDASVTDSAVNTWPRKPESFRDTFSQYRKEVKSLGLQLLRLIARSLGLPENLIESSFGPLTVLTSLNFYPRCPQPDLVIGASAHSDPNLITLLHENDVPGLQVLRGERWILVRPRLNHLVVNLGDQLEILSNGKCKSCLHRVMANSEKDRLSVVAFMEPDREAVVSPAKLVVESHPAKYRSIKYKDYAGLDSLKF